MQWILVTGYTFLILAFLPRIPFFRLQGIPAIWLQGIFILKVLAGIALGFIYSRYYTDRGTADTFKFFDDSRIIFNSIHENFRDFIRMFSGYNANAPDLVEKYYSGMTAWNNREMFFNDNRSIIRLNVLFQFISLGNYYVHVVLMNLFSFTGLICFYKAFEKFIAEKKRLLFAGIFLFPSVLFWGSGLLKDGLLLFSVGLCLLSFLKITEHFRWKYLTGLIIGITGLLFNKFYIFFILLPGLIAYLICKSKSKYFFWYYAGVYLLFFLFLYGLKFLPNGFDFLSILESKRRDFAAIAISGKAVHLLQLPTDPLTLLSFISQIPRSVITVLFRPFLWEADSVPVLLSALENILIFSCGAMIFIFPSYLSRKNSIFFLAIFFILALCVLIGMITPILGAIVRYRIIAIPFLVFVLLYCIDFSKLSRYVHKKSNPEF